MVNSERSAVFQYLATTIGSTLKGFAGIFGQSFNTAAAYIYALAIIIDTGLAQRVAQIGRQAGWISSTTPLRVEPVGDSITEGFGSTTGNGYRAPLYTALKAEDHPQNFVGSHRDGSMLDPDNEGWSGNRIDEVASQHFASVAAYQPNIVTLLLGVNDLRPDYQRATAPQPT